MPGDCGVGRKAGAERRARLTVLSRDGERLLPRLSDRKVHGIFTGLGGQPFPDGALKMLRRQLDQWWRASMTTVTTSH
ncbi:DUF7740 domain-containing protein [Cronobacter sakazakii]|uniref:DUF7740 domain-containing protein n=1 Tax=Cronobacter sakazakii TaxID=28141 RepID=UPI003FEF213F